MSHWTRFEDLRRQLQKLWDRGRLLSDPELWPLRLRVSGPSPGDLGARFGEVSEWVRYWLQVEDRQSVTLEWREVNSRDIGRNRLPAAVIFSDRDSALAPLGKRRAAREFDALRDEILAGYPVLRDWIQRRPLRVLELREQWPRLLSVLHWLQDHPRPDIYIRQLELPGVDTKFIERHRKVLGELLDVVLDPDNINDVARGVSAFEARYGFRHKPAQVRFRILDAGLYLRGLSDLQIPVQDFAALAVPVDTVFIVENEITGLAFPNRPRSVVVFGLGYGLDLLASAHWLRESAIIYWGDIDTHGFAMLNQLRGLFPAARSLLMDRSTLLAHEALWGREETQARRTLPLLTAQEQALYEDLCADRIAPGLRLEQERIAFGCLRDALQLL